MFSMLYTTTGSEEEAEKISSELLEKRLVACANIFPIRSMYWWKGEIEKENEFAIIFKTKTELLKAAMGTVKELHSYEVPCLICYESVQGDEGYLNWITEETRKD
jgi:periplasmic divalent cation tolerance protein